MTTILLVILGVLLAAAAVLFVVYYGGDAFGNGKIEAEAGRLVSEGAQMEAALELFYRQEGHYPTSEDPVAELMAAGYLSHEPLGTRTATVDRWRIDYDAGMIRALLGPSDSEESSSICLKARQQLELPVANTATGIYRCDGTDSPGGRLSGREPCCIGEVGVGGGPAGSGDIFATATLCNNLGNMPVGTEAEKAAYITAAGACVEQRSQLTNQRLTSLSDIGNPPIDDAATGAADPIIEENANGNIWFRYDVATQAQCDAIGYRPNGSFSQSLEEQCYWGYRVPRRYYKRLTDTYRPTQVNFLESEADKIATSIAQKGYLGSDMSEFVSNYGGYSPDMKGQTSSPWGIAEVNNYVHVQAAVPHEGLCTWFRSNKGYSGNKYDSGLQYPSYCWLTGGNHTFQRNVTSQVQGARLAKLKVEAEKLRDSLLASTYGGTNMSTFLSQGGYSPQLNGLTSDTWQIVSNSNGAVNLRVTHPKHGACGWWRTANGKDNNGLNQYPREPEYCGHFYNGPAYYDRNISVQYRAKQKSILERERLKLRADYVDKGGNTAAMTYQPNFNGVAPNSGSFYTRSGKVYYRSKIDTGLCYYLYDEVNATSNNHTNMLNFHYRKTMCLDFYGDGTYALLDLTVD